MANHKERHVNIEARTACVKLVKDDLATCRSLYNVPRILSACYYNVVIIIQTIGNTQSMLA